MITREALLNAFSVEQWISFGWLFGTLIVIGLILIGIERGKR